MLTKLNCLLSFILMWIMIANSTAQIDPGTENLTHSWNFNDGTANDYIGGANGTLMGDAEVGFGSLLVYDQDSWMEMPGDLISLNTYEGITLDIWFISVSGGNTSYHMIAYFGDSTMGGLGKDYYFTSPARQDDVCRTAISCGDSSTPWAAESFANGPELDDGELHHVVSTLSSDTIALYIDGVLMDTTELASRPNNIIANISSRLAYLAKSGYGGDLEWLGEILEFNIYNRALSSEEVLFLFNKGATDVEDGITVLPKEYNLLQNYPNPFNPETKISFELPKESAVKIKVYDMLGREIAVLLEEVKPAGRHIVEFDGTKLSSGVYIYRMEISNQVFSRKMILLR